MVLFLNNWYNLKTLKKNYLMLWSINKNNQGINYYLLNLIIKKFLVDENIKNKK